MKYFEAAFYFEMCYDINSSSIDVIIQVTLSLMAGKWWD